MKDLENRVFGWKPTCELRFAKLRHWQTEPTLQQKWVKTEDYIDGGYIEVAEWRQIENIGLVED